MAKQNTSTRRGALLAALCGASAAALPALGSTHPDAALIAACDGYRGLMDALNHGDHGEEDDGPVHQAYFACCDTISEGEPQTMAGVLAMCRAIKAEARDRDGAPTSLHGTIAEDWALEVVDALLRLNGGAA